MKFEIFDFHICFGYIFVLFCGNSKILALFGEGGRGGHFKIQTQKYLENI